MNTKSINNLLNHINSAKQGSYKKQGICVLLGAGADISSGGILFRELKQNFLKENEYEIPYSASDIILDKQFEECVGKMSQDSRCETLDKIMKRNSSPSEGYLLLVMLAEMGFIDAVITTNFDYLLEETQKLLNMNPFSIFTPGKAIPEEYYLHRSKLSPIYIKMHGDLSDRLVTHLTQEEIGNRQYGDKFIKLFEHIIQNNILIVVGYNGYDSLITEIIQKKINYIDDVYWCNICNPKEDSKLVSILQNENKLSYINTSFDHLFQELARTLLKEVKLKDTNPIFLPTVVQSKMDNQISKFRDKIINSNMVIERTDELKMLEHYLGKHSNKCIAITGDYKFGKSCFLYTAMQRLKDISFFPISCNQNYTVLENMVQALGYNADVPFPIMYNFLKWWNETGKQLVFVIDDFFNFNYYETSKKYFIDFFDFLYIAREFKYIQFILCFQNSIYNELEQDNTFALLGNIISGRINIEKFSNNDMIKLLKNNGVTDNNLAELQKQEILHIPYVWEIINNNHIVLTKDQGFFPQFINTLYHISAKKYDFTEHAFKEILGELAYNQLFHAYYKIDFTTPEYIFLHERNILNENDEIVYLEFAVYLCVQHMLNVISRETSIVDMIILESEKVSIFSDCQLDVYASVLAEVENIDQYDVVLNNLQKIASIDNVTFYLEKLIIKTLQICFKHNKELFKCYLQSIDVNRYSSKLQCYLFKVCADLCPKALEIWNEVGHDSKLSYAAFILCNDSLYNALKESLQNNQLDIKLFEKFNTQNGFLKLIHILTYYGWDNLNNSEYMKLKSIIANEIISFISINDSTIQYAVTVLLKYAYNIFFNAGEDFEEQFVRCHCKTIHGLAHKVLAHKAITQKEYLELLKINNDVNNSWLFIISNIIIVQSMKNQPCETYNMLLHFWDNEQLDVKAEHLDFFLSSAFWALYVNEARNRKKFVTLFEKVVKKFERILFMFPSTERNASLLKFSEEFDRMFEDGFNPIAFYFYTAPYESLAEFKDWNNGQIDLKIYWDFAECLSDLGKFDDILRIVHALGQMISIYPNEGFSALQNLVQFDRPIIKRGIIRIFKENYLRYSRITKDELQKSIYHFNSDDIDEIIYNSDFLLENRTMEQLHWGRAFYNLEQLTGIDVSEKFLSNVLQASSCSGFLRAFIKSLI